MASKKSKVISIDVGFGYTKFCILEGMNHRQEGKFANAYANVGEGHIDDNIIEIGGKRYYVGQEALGLPQSKVIEVMDYESFKIISPFVIKKVITNLQMDVLIISLSAVFLDKSKDYKSYISEQLNISEDKIILIPQGIGGKITIDYYGLNPNKASSSNETLSSYLIVDVGHNTVDIVPVVNSKAVGSDVKGFDGMGTVWIAKKIKESISSSYNVNISLAQAKQIMMDRSFSRLGAVIDLEDLVIGLEVKYIESLTKLLTEKFSESIMASVDGIVLLGGGSYLIQNKLQVWQECDLFKNPSFTKFPKSHAEYYNVIGGGLQAYK